MSEIVLVDDNSDHLELMLLALRSLGGNHAVATFRSGEACVLAVEQGLLKSDLILLDVNMPGLDGPATCQRLRALGATRSVPIVMLSTSEQRSDVLRARAAGADSYVAKPRRDQTWRNLMETLIRYWTETDLMGRA